MAVEAKCKSTGQVLEWLAVQGVDAFEYQCGRGVHIKTDSAEELGRLAAEHDISLSLHAPYYISLSSAEEEKRLNSANYLLQSARALRAMGGNRIVLHSGSAGKLERGQALALASETLRYCLERLDEQGYGDMTLCPETMGKMGQLGSLDEVMQLCLIDERLIPCIDFGHLNARTQGSLRTRADYENILNTIENRLGTGRLQHFHAHFSKIEYTAGGEKRHLTFSDQTFGPDPQPLLELIADRKLTPTIICESDGTQAEDALEMKRMYLKLAGWNTDNS